MTSDEDRLVAPRTAVAAELGLEVDPRFTTPAWMPPELAGWRPPLSFQGVPYAVVVYTTAAEPKSCAATWYGETVSLLVAQFLEVTRQGLGPANRADEVSFLYVVVAREPGTDEAVEIGKDTALAEFGFGSAPAAPEDWPTVPLEHLMNTAVAWLLAD